VSGIRQVLTGKTFKANTAATFTYEDSATSSTRTFLALNDQTNGFTASTDAIIEITGYAGDLKNLYIA